jgi:hypothetical protein
MRETFYDGELSCAATFRNVLGQVIKRARGLLFYRGSRGLKKMVSFGGAAAAGRSAEFKRPFLKGSFFPEKRTDRVTPVFRDPCASNYPSPGTPSASPAYHPPPVWTAETLGMDRVTPRSWFLQLVKTSSSYSTAGMTGGGG